MKVTIVYGFLGSGKTTFIRYLVALIAPEQKVAILVNELGEIGVDGEILASDNLFVEELTSGCICCSIRGDFIKVMEEIYQKWQPERLIIEPTGVAIPEHIEEVFTYTSTSSFAYIDTIITIVDASRFEVIKEDFEPLLVEQIAKADPVIVNKADLVEESDIRKVVEEVRQLNPTAAIYTTTFCQITPELLLGNIQPPAKKAIPKPLQDTNTEMGLESLSVDLYELPLSHLKEVLKRFDSGEFGRIIRAKGFVRTDEGKFQVDYTMGEVDFKPYAGKRYMLIIIGKELKRDDIKQALSNYGE